jgi:hypothetical protein
MAPAAPRPAMDIGGLALKWGWAIQALGLLFIFIGTVWIISVVANPSCAFNTPTCLGQSTYQSAATGLMVGKILWVLGLTFIIVGLGSKLQWGLPRPSDDSKDAVWRYVGFERFWHAVLIIVLIVVIWMVLTSVNGLPTPPTPPA